MMLRVPAISSSTAANTDRPTPRISHLLSGFCQLDYRGALNGPHHPYRVIARRRPRTSGTAIAAHVTSPLPAAAKTSAASLPTVSEIGPIAANPIGASADEPSQSQAVTRAST